MLMIESLAQKVAREEKDQTRRPVKDGDELVERDGLKTVLHNGRIKYQVGRVLSLQYSYGKPTRYWNQAEGLMNWEFYQEFSAKHGVNFHEISKLMGWYPLQIRLLDIWQEDVRSISFDDALAEGFSCPNEFLVTWCNFYDKSIDIHWLAEYGVPCWEFRKEKGLFIDDAASQVEIPNVVQADFPKWLTHRLDASRINHLYQAWALKFGLVKP